MNIAAVMIAEQDIRRDRHGIGTPAALRASAAGPVMPNLRRAIVNQRPVGEVEDIERLSILDTEEGRSARIGCR